MLTVPKVLSAKNRTSNSVINALFLVLLLFLVFTKYTKGCMVKVYTDARIGKITIESGLQRLSEQPGSVPWQWSRKIRGKASSLVSIRLAVYPTVTQFYFKDRVIEYSCSSSVHSPLTLTKKYFYGSGEGIRPQSYPCFVSLYISQPQPIVLQKARNRRHLFVLTMSRIPHCEDPGRIDTSADANNALISLYVQRIYFELQKGIWFSASQVLWWQKFSN